MALNMPILVQRLHMIFDCPTANACGGFNIIDGHSAVLTSDFQNLHRQLWQITQNQALSFNFGV